MKILIDARFYGLENAGLGRYTVELVENLSKIDKANKYFVLLRKKYFDKISLPENWTKVLCDYKHYSINEQLNIPKIVKKINPDISHYLHFNISLLVPKPYIVTIHDMIMHHSSGVEATTLPIYQYLIKRIGYKISFRNSVKKAKKIITPSKTVKNEVSKYYSIDPNKIDVTPLGISDVFLEKNKKTSKDDYLLYIGNAYPHKNIIRLIKVIKKINRKLKIITSRGVFYERLKNTIIDLGAEENVDLNAFTNEKQLAEIYRKALAFVYPSTIEGFGFQGLEAMASKTLVCASNIPVFKEIYKDNAIYFDPKSEKSLASSLEMIFNMTKEEKNKRLEKAHKYAQKYNWALTAQKTRLIYEKLLKKT